MTSTFLVNFLLEDDPRDFLNRTFTPEQIRHQLVALAVEAAELVLPIFERKFPKDNRPRKAIEAAKAWLKNPSKENATAVNAARAATYAAYAAYAAAANAAAYSARAATYAAYAAVNAAYAAVNAARAATRAANAPQLKAKIEGIKARIDWLKGLLDK